MLPSLRLCMCCYSPIAIDAQGNVTHSFLLVAADLGNNLRLSFRDLNLTGVSRFTSTSSRHRSAGLAHFLKFENGERDRENPGWHIPFRAGGLGAFDHDHSLGRGAMVG